MTTARETFLKQILALDPEIATGFKTHPGPGHPEAKSFKGLAKMVWNEGNLRYALGIPEVPPAPILFTIDVPSPLNDITPFHAYRFEVTAEALARAASAELERGIEAGAWTTLQRVMAENEALRERIFALEGGFSTITPAAYRIAEEVQKARAKYPQSDLNSRIDGFVQEAGEAMQALIKVKHGMGSVEHALLEVIQAAGQAVRIIEECWQPPQPTRHCAGLDEHEEAR